MADAEYVRAVGSHYNTSDLEGRILADLQAAGKDLAALTPDDLVRVDQFHSGGRAATLDLARRTGVGAGQAVLDSGGGVGGPARTLAATFGCRVTVVDLTEEYCRTGAALTARLGLADRVWFAQGNALALPFPAGAFDLAWTQHSSMNIADKARLYAELYRVVRPGGRLALHEILAGPGGPVHFPVPWAGGAAISFLCSPAEAQAAICGAGFRPVAWEDQTAAALAWFQRLVAASTAAPGVSGVTSPPMITNLVRNLAEQRIVVVQAVYER